MINNIHDDNFYNNQKFDDYDDIFTEINNMTFFNSSRLQFDDDQLTNYYIHIYVYILAFKVYHVIAAIHKQLSIMNTLLGKQQKYHNIFKWNNLLYDSFYI